MSRMRGLFDVTPVGPLWCHACRASTLVVRLWTFFTFRQKANCKTCGQRSLSYQKYAQLPVWNVLPFELRYKEIKVIFKRSLETSQSSVKCVPSFFLLFTLNFKFVKTFHTYVLIYKIYVFYLFTVCYFVVNSWFSLS